MNEFTKPNYLKNNIINLMSSISNSFNQQHSYPQLDSLNITGLKSTKNVLLFVIDGLGYNFLMQQKNSFLYSNLHSRLTTTFLSATASANTAFHVGYPPQQHGVLGWTTHIEEVGGITKVLPFIKDKNITDEYDINKILDIKSFHEGFDGQCFTIIEEQKSTREFVKYVSKGSTIIPAKTRVDIVNAVKDLVIKESSERRFIHAYFDDFDTIQHQNGSKSQKTLALFQSIDDEIKNLSKAIENTNTVMLIVADHGLIDLNAHSEIWAEDIDGFKECLRMEMTGEPRVRDCFLKPSTEKDFEIIVKEKMSDYCWCFKGEQLINDNFYGLGKVNKKLFDRVGDYVLIMKDDYVLREKPPFYQKPMSEEKASHGALSTDEMAVPLIVINC